MTTADFDYKPFPPLAGATVDKNCEQLMSSMVGDPDVYAIENYFVTALRIGVFALFLGALVYYRMAKNKYPKGQVPTVPFPSFRS